MKYRSPRYLLGYLIGFVLGVMGCEMSEGGVICDRRGIPRLKVRARKLTGDDLELILRRQIAQYRAELERHLFED